MTTTTKKIAIIALPNMRDPTVRRREQCIERLEDQKKLLADSAYVRVTMRKKKGEQPTEHRQKVTQWWSGVRDGVALRLRFVQGAQGVVVGNIKDLEPAIDDIIGQIRDGSLDAMIAPKEKVKKEKAPKVDPKKPAHLNVVGQRRIGSKPK